MIGTMTVHTISLTDVCNAVTKDLYQTLWDEVSGHIHGNQVFSNDSLFIYVLPSLNGDALSKVQRTLHILCRRVIIDHTIIFEVSW